MTKYVPIFKYKVQFAVFIFRVYHVYKVNTQKSMTKHSGGCAVENNISTVFICRMLVTVNMFMRCKIKERTI